MAKSKSKKAPKKGGGKGKGTSPAKGKKKGAEAKSAPPAKVEEKKTETIFLSPVKEEEKKVEAKVVSPSPAKEEAEAKKKAGSANPPIDDDCKCEDCECDAEECEDEIVEGTAARKSTRKSRGKSLKLPGEDVDEDEEEEEEEDDEEDEESEPDDQEFMELMQPKRKGDDAENDGTGVIDLMLKAEMEDEDMQTLFLADGGVDAEEVQGEDLTGVDGVVGITLSEEARKFFHLENFNPDAEPKIAWLMSKKVRLYMYTYLETSEFQPYYETIMDYPDVAMLLGHDLQNQTGQDFFLCITMEARNRVMHPPKSKRVFVDLKKKESEKWNEMASIKPRRWKGLGSEAEVNDSQIISKPKVVLSVSRLRNFFGDDPNFENTDPDDPRMSATFDSVPPRLRPCVHRREIDRGTQVTGVNVTTSTQTEASFKRNKMVQLAVQTISEENKATIMKSKDMVQFFKSVLPRLEKVLQQNEMVDLLFNDYKHLKARRGHEMEFSSESMLLQEYQTYADDKNTKGRMVTWMRFHPVLEDVVVLALGEDVTFDRRVDTHSKVLMNPNFVLFWDLKDSSHPQIMLDAPNDVFTFMVNPSDPHLVCGGCANGQVILWDLGRSFYELKARTQDRTHKTTSNEGTDKTMMFLDTLKDTTEKYVCPLIAPSGLSNLEHSHKKTVTSTYWLPAHVELGKNGTMYENTAGGKSVQFFSLAGDGSLRLWDIRPPKETDEMDPSMMDEEGAERRDVIKVNPWAHLENSKWKFVLKIILADEAGGPMYATLMSLSETRKVDAPLKRIESTQSLSAVDSSASITGSKINIKTSKSKSKTKSKSKSKTRSTATKITEDEERERRGTENEDEDEDEDNVEPEVEMELNRSSRKFDVLRTLKSGRSTIFMGTETGDIAFVDWLKTKDGNANTEWGVKMCQNIYVKTYHDGAITSIMRSPFYSDLYLVVGGGTITIWKEECVYPIVQCIGSDMFYWCAAWSNSRPGVFFVGTREGYVAVWDLMDRSNGPVVSQQVSNVRITAIALPFVAVSASKKQLIAITDAEGILYVLIIPRFYARPLPHENATMMELMTREEKRLNLWETDVDPRNEKLNMIHDFWAKDKTIKTEQEQLMDEVAVEERLNKEYMQFLKYQKQVVDFLKNTEPVLPTEEEEDLNEEFESLVMEAQKKQRLDDEMEAEEEEDEDEEEDAEVEEITPGKTSIPAN